MDNLTFAQNMRKNILSSAFKAGSNGAHIAPSLSCVEILAALYKNILKSDPADAFSSSRDRMILSKGHAGLALYAALYESGLITKEDFDSFEENGGNFPGQPSKNIAKRIEFSGGSLGLGLSYAAGLALEGNRVYVLLGDGECNEGSVWESAMFIGHNRLKNVTAVVDFNGMQADGKSENVLTFNAKKMWEAAGWTVIECEGHDVDALTQALNTENDTPLVVIAKTTKGKGVSFMENSPEWHHSRLSQAQLEKALAEITEAHHGN